MKSLIIIAVLFISAGIVKQTPLPHGAVYGTKPTSTAPVDASKLDAYMGNKVRISTTIKGTVLAVTKPQGGWFNIDGGNGKIIAAHFSKAGISIPANLKGKTVIAEGVAAKQFIADDSQPFAGDTVKGKKQHKVNTSPKKGITFEVSGLMVE